MCKNFMKPVTFCQTLFPHVVLNCNTQHVFKRKYDSSLTSLVLTWSHCLDLAVKPNLALLCPSIFLSPYSVLCSLVHCPLSPPCTVEYLRLYPGPCNPRQQIRGGYIYMTHSHHECARNQNHLAQPNILPYLTLKMGLLWNLISRWDRLCTYFCIQGFESMDEKLNIESFALDGYSVKCYKNLLHRCQEINYWCL